MDMDSSFDPNEHVFRSPAFESIIAETIEFLNETRPQPLPPPQRFTGPGVYLLYYRGGFKPYASITTRNAESLVEPIYAGKAVPRGWRQGRLPNTSSAALYNRLRKHARSIRAVENLTQSDFACRFILLKGKEADLITTVENALIRQYSPLWNSVIDGFGNNDPGATRYTQKLADWDTLHPGRSWEQKWEGPRPEPSAIVAEVKAHYRGRRSSTTDS